MQARLVVVEPATQVTEYTVTLPLTIGRGREAGLQLPHALVSRMHCKLIDDDGRILVRDLGSLNGTFVAGKRVESAPLLPGQLLTIGSVTLRAMYGDDALPAESSDDVKEVEAAIETVSIDDTAQASVKVELDEAGEPLRFGDDSLGEFLRPSDN